MIGENKWDYMNKIRPSTECLSPTVFPDIRRLWINWPVYALHDYLKLQDGLEKCDLFCAAHWLAPLMRLSFQSAFIECAPDNRSMSIKTMHLLLSVHWMTFNNLKTYKIHQMYDNMDALYRRMYVLMIDWFMCTMDGQMTSIHQVWMKIIHPCNHEWMNGWISSIH